ncbi:DUF6114 domain-containing protein [Streptomyces sp. NPDC050418]|uniref:DUF6114 domain-containing protein n=1 Tax=Streptomyces sp. NPDC050418 TaxID=3365612 RepID=UPI0037A4BFFC
MSADAPGRNDHIVKVYWRKFRAWRGSRPFWAGLFTILGGIPIAYFPYASLKFGNLTLAMQTTGGASAAIIGVLLITLGFTLWFHHIVRVFAGVAAIILGLVSIPLSNLGGFGIGLLCSLIGGGLAIAWVPGKPAEQKSSAQEEQPEPEPDTAPHTDEAGGADTTLETNGGRHHSAG